MTDLLIPATLGARPDTSESARRMRKVLHVVNGEHYAGAARVQDLLALALPNFGYDVSFACVLPDRFEAERQSQECSLHKFPMKHRLDFGPARRVADLVKSEGFDLIHSHTTRSAMIAATAAKMSGVPYVHHVHCQMNTEVGQRLKTFVNTSIERFACRTADQVIAVSDSIRRFLGINGFTKTGVTVVPNGVSAPPKLKTPRGPGDPWTIGMIALLRERKGLETLLHALPKLAHNSNDVRLRIVGPFETPDYEYEIMQQVEQLGICELIDWTGFVRDVHAEIAQMDVLVLPSVLPEGMPMVLLEAMSTGVPIVGSRVDGITDVIRHEENGLLAEAGNAEMLSAELQKILLGVYDWNQLRNNCLADYEKKYSDSAMAGNVSRVYDSVLSARNATSAERGQEFAK